MGTHSFRANRSLEEKLSYIQRRLGTNQSRAIAESIHTLYEQLKRRDEEPAPLIDIFEDLGLLGGMETEATLSENYKQKLIDLLTEGYDGGE